MRFMVVGTGAVGSFVAGSLANAGHEVAAEGRGAHFAAAVRDGLTVRGDHGTFRTRLGALTGDDLAGTPPDAVLIAVKAHALAPLAPRLAAWAGRGVAVVTLQNGLPHWFFDGIAGVLRGKRLRSVDADGALAAALPARAIVAAVVNVGARIPSPGVVEQIGDRSFVLGEAGGGASVRTAALVEAFAGAGLEATADEDIRLPIWRKLASNAALNPVSALARAGLEEMVDDAPVAALIAVVVDEMLAIGRAAGLNVDLPRAALLEKARAYGDQRTSMLQDLEAGRQLEIGPILDAPLEVADVLGVAAPMARQLAALVHLLDTTAAQRGVQPAASEPPLT